MIVSELCVYPVKSCQGIYLDRVKVTKTGFFLDREMMLVSNSGKFITQRQFPQLARVKVEIIEQDIILSLDDENLTSAIAQEDLINKGRFIEQNTHRSEFFKPDNSKVTSSFQGGKQLTLPFASTGTNIEVEIWGDRVQAIDCGDAVADWFYQLLNLDGNKTCRLVKRSPNHARIVKRKYPRQEDVFISFADNYPVMLTATASLVELNQRISEIHLSQKQAIPMNRFRPNIVVETTEPFIEDRWNIIQIGEIKFKVAKPCSRCIITTIDRRGKKDRLKEPLNTLSTFRQLSEQGVMFGVNLIPQNEGIIRTSDRLQVFKMRD